MSKNLDHAYDEYLKEHSEEVAKAIPLFHKRLKKSHFRYGRVTIPTFLKPHFITQIQERLLRRSSKILSQVINTATRLFFEEGHFSHLFEFSPTVSELIRIDPGYSQTVVFSRYNTLLEGESLKVLDFNCDSPVGAGYTDEVEKVMLEEPVLKDFVEKYYLQNNDRAKMVLDTLLNTYEEFGGYEAPQIAILDWRNVRTRHESECLKENFEERGYKTVLADPRDLKYKGGHLYFKDFRIRLVLRRFFFDELLERIDEVEDFLKAYRDKAVCVVNPLRASLGDSKALLSMLTNPEYDHYFTDAENQAKKDFIPWTRRIKDAAHFYGNKTMYIIDFLKDEKETLVLKPGFSYGGKGIKIGCETPDRDWNGIIDKAIKEDWFVQEYINVPIMTVPAVINRKLDFQYKKHNFNMLVFGSRYSGSFTRLSDESVISVAQGGGLIPTIVPDFAPERFGG